MWQPRGRGRSQRWVALPEPIQYPPIDPVPAGTERPFWSVVIPTYNRTRYLERTLRSVLEQDPGPAKMQIEVVDNCSTEGNAEEVVRAVAGDRVAFHRQPRTLDLHENWNSCIGRTRGHWVHLLHDDDAVLPGFYATYERLIQQHPDATLITGPSIHVDEDDRRVGEDPPLIGQAGTIPDFALRMATSNPLKTPSVVISRATYEQVGGFCELLSHTADWEMFFRAGSAGRAVATVEPGSVYRIHARSDSSRLVRDGRNIEEILAAVELCFARLPPALQSEIGHDKYTWTASVAYGCSRHLAKEGLWRGSLIQATWALRLAPRARFLLAWFWTAAQAARHPG